MKQMTAKVKWLKGLGETEFLQFAYGRITREPFPLGGYFYTTTDLRTVPAKDVYSGSSYQGAYAAIPQNVTCA